MGKNTAFLSPATDRHRDLRRSLGSVGLRVNRGFPFSVADLLVCSFIYLLSKKILLGVYELLAKCKWVIIRVAKGTPTRLRLSQINSFLYY